MTAYNTEIVPSYTYLTVFYNHSDVVWFTFHLNKVFLYLTKKKPVLQCYCIWQLVFGRKSCT